MTKINNNINYQLCLREHGLSRNQNLTMPLLVKGTKSTTSSSTTEAPPLGHRITNLDPVRQLVLTEDIEGKLRVRDLLTKKYIWEIELRNNRQNTVCLSGNKVVIATTLSVGFNSVIMIYDLKNGQLLACLKSSQFKSGIQSIQVVGQRIFAGLADLCVGVWNVNNGQFVQRLFIYYTANHYVIDHYFISYMGDTLLIYNVLTDQVNEVRLYNPQISNSKMHIMRIYSEGSHVVCDLNPTVDGLRRGYAIVDFIAGTILWHKSFSFDQSILYENMQMKGIAENRGWLYFGFSDPTGTLIRAVLHGEKRSFELGKQEGLLKAFFIDQDLLISVSSTNQSTEIKVWDLSSHELIKQMTRPFLLGAVCGFMEGKYYHTLHTPGYDQFEIYDFLNRRTDD